MEEKYMVNDILESSKKEIIDYTNAIIASSNIELRQILQSVRNNLESFQNELFKLAISKGYYEQESVITPEEINKIKNKFSNN